MRKKTKNPNTIAYIIFMNNEPKKVILNDDQKALKETKKMSDAFYESVKHAAPLSRDDYNIIYYWHLHEVEVLT